jgi:hypothetical protein
MQVGIPCRLHNAVEQGLCSILAICHEYGIQTVIRAVALCPFCNERGVCLTIGINEQLTSIGSASTSQHSCDAKRGIGGGCRFADTPLWLIKTKRGALPFPLSLNKPIKNRCAGKDFAEAC